ncbi:hypothetical protein HOU03_gp483 [Caulobacter phage CcrSC]|uniref:Uncharacterized protein n=1 Tax=Caulobacter phage CcrSC TaxID=2283272 RepID=A0A385ED29_9CAUD|nr:hypothetical protein HOU03_gp483 [Caulobacter phage CcrSC]AXQ69784.1 hypothetical protein CcrSC_gp202 [Caulobacter phage CcrSC]
MTTFLFMLFTVSIVLAAIVVPVLVLTHDEAPRSITRVPGGVNIQPTYRSTITYTPVERPKTSSSGGYSPSPKLSTSKAPAAKKASSSAKTPSRRSSSGSSSSYSSTSDDSYLYAAAAAASSYDYGSSYDSSSSSSYDCGSSSFDSGSCDTSGGF